MSPRWTTELAVGIGAWDLSVQLTSRLPGGRMGETKSYALNGPQEIAEVGKTLAHAIKRIKGDAPPPSTARVMLGDHWAQYALMTGDFRLQSARDAEKLAGQYLQSALDLREVPLACSAEVLPGGRALFAAGIERDLLNTVTSTLLQAGIGLRSATTWFAAVSPTWRRALPARRCVIASEFEGSLQVLVAEGSRWQSFASDAVRRASAFDVRQRADLFLRRLGESVDTVALAIATPLLAEPKGEAQKTLVDFTRLQTPQLKAGQPMSLALLGAMA